MTKSAPDTKDIGLTHIALPVADVDRSIEFYATYAAMAVIHRRTDAATGVAVAWLCDGTRPFAIVLIQTDSVQTVLSPLAHLGVGCPSRAEIDLLCDRAQQAGVLLQPPQDSGYPIGYWAFLRDPDGHTLELSYGQEIGLTVEQTGRSFPLQDMHDRLAAIEERLRQAMLRSDVAELDTLISNELLFTNYLGQIVSKEADLDVHRTGKLKFTEITLAEIQIQIDRGFAVVMGLAHLVGDYDSNSIDLDIRFTRVWSIADSGTLQIVACHASMIPTQLVPDLKF